MENPDIRSMLREIADFPAPGVTFFDATPLMADASIFARTIALLAGPFQGRGIRKVIGAESRGFYLAAPVACALGAGFVPARKPGKLPFETRAAKASPPNYDGVVDIPGLAESRITGPSTYLKQYEFEMHTDGVLPGEDVLVVDDLLAKGGTAAACCRLVEQAGGNVVACVFLIELVNLGGAQSLKPYDVHSLFRFGESAQDPTG